jgi:hypothetical protein
MSLPHGSNKASYKEKERLKIKEENVNKYYKRQSLGKQGYKELASRSKRYQ